MGFGYWKVVLMIHVTYSPQFNDSIPVTYSWTGDALTAAIGDTSDTFDFSGLQSGDSVDTSTIDTTLPYVPVVAAERLSDGTLNVTLLYTYNSDEPNSKASETI